jgi:predicted GNAT superfamily acetyltransferase
MCLLAYGDDGQPLGASYSFLANLDGEIVLWSHSTAALIQDQGVGSALKARQRELASERGIQTIAWTFDPLVPRNAYFNLVKLGVEVVEFVENLYGEILAPTGEVSQSDRLVVRSRINEATGSLTVMDRLPPGVQLWSSDDPNPRGRTFCRIDVPSPDDDKDAPRQCLRHLMSLGRPLVGIVVEQGRGIGYVVGETGDQA